MERLINRRQQGDLGEASAIEWLTRAGATVFLPFGHSPDVDLVALVDGRALRVQVKTTVCRLTTPDGFERWSVLVATRGGNRSWSGTAKLLDRDRLDLLFVLVGDGRRWMIPAAEIEATTSIQLGGPKYSEFEIETGLPVRDLVYGVGGSFVNSASVLQGEYPSGQRTAAVNRQALPSQVRILPPPSPSRSEAAGRTPAGQTRISGKRQIVVPKRAFDAAGLMRGDRLKAMALGPGEVLFRRIEASAQQPRLPRNDEEPPGGGPSSQAALDRG